MLAAAIRGHAILDRKKGLPGPDLKAEKVVSHNGQFIYIGVPKAGTRSCLSMLQDLAGHGYDLSIYERPLCVLACEPWFAGYRKFTFVRGPVDRLISCFYDKISFHNKGLTRTDIAIRERVIARYPALERNMSMTEFVDWLNGSEGSDAHADRHWLSQHRFLTLKGCVVVDYIGNIETFCDDVEALASCLNVPFKPCLKNVGRAARTDPVPLQIANKIKQRYSIDICKIYQNATARWLNQAQ